MEIVLEERNQSLSSPQPSFKKKRKQASVIKPKKNPKKQKKRNELPPQLSARTSSSPYTIKKLCMEFKIPRTTVQSALHQGRLKGYQGKNRRWLICVDEVKRFSKAWKKKST